MSQNVPTSLEVKEKQVEYLEAMAQKHGLPDRNKALRCLINFAMQEKEHESSIFTQIRCNDC